MANVRISKNSTSAALTAMATVVIAAFVVAALYFGREILIPLALAALLAFLLSPLVTRLERWIGRVGATMLSVAMLFVVIGAIGWTLTVQMVDLAEKLPGYQVNIQNKLKSLKVPGNNRFSAFNKTIEEIKKDLPGVDQNDNPGADKDQTVVVAPRPGGSVLPKAPVSDAKPVPVQVVETTSGGPMSELGLILGSLAGPLGTATLVLILLFCMLVQREDLRGRLIRVIGSDNISATTRGMDDAARRVGRYLLMQGIVNGTYGVVIAIGLYFIGVPNAFVWGVLATVLRFIPYVGAWIAMGFPILISLAASSNWIMPIETIALFVVLELIVNNVMEPLLYGSSTGVSSIALIVAAVFWTWIWGTPGLVLATPLTVCLVVMGRYVPRLAVISVLLSDEEALTPFEEFYHRLLTPNNVDAAIFATQYLKANSRTALYDSVAIPALTAVERDQATGSLDKEQYNGVLQELRDVVEDIGNRPPEPSKLEADKAAAAAQASAPPAPPAATCRVLVLPVRTDRDEITGAMLNQLLQQASFESDCLKSKLTTGELLEAVDKDTAEVVCVSVAPPSTIMHARYMCTKLRAHSSTVKCIVGLWGATEGLTESTARLRETGADEVVTTLADAVLQCSKFATALAQEAILNPLPNDELDRLLDLQNLHVLDTGEDPALDRITQKVAHVLNAPISLITLVDKDRQVFKSQCGLPKALADAGQTPRDLSVCSHVVANDEVLVVEDLARDRRFSKNPLLRDNGFRSYAGTPLRSRNGHVLGALCVLDYKPRLFADNEKRFLQVMAGEVMDVINNHPALPAASEAVTTEV